MQRYPAQFHLSSNLYLWGQGLGNSREKWILIWYILYFDGKKKNPQSLMGSRHMCLSLFLKPLYTELQVQKVLYSKNRFLDKCFDFLSLFTVQLSLLLRPLIVLPSNYLFLWLIKWVLYIYLSLIAVWNHFKKRSVILAFLKLVSSRWTRAKCPELTRLLTLKTVQVFHTKTFSRALYSRG